MAIVSLKIVVMVILAGHSYSLIHRLQAETKMFKLALFHLDPRHVEHILECTRESVLYMDGLDMGCAICLSMRHFTFNATRLRK
jgi:hypothetical protein